MSKGDAKTKKAQYTDKLKQLFDEHSSIFLVNIDNVGSNQMHQIRISLRGQGVVVMGKNTLVRRAMHQILPDHPKLERLMNHVRGNVGFVFTKGDLKEVRDQILENRVQAPAKAGALAPIDVVVPAGNTGLEPGKTSFFQSLTVPIPTKIARGTIEISNDVKVISAGDRVGVSEATLLNMLNISPFTYGLTILSIYDAGTVFSPEVLDIEESALIANLLTGIQNIAAISLAAGFPTVASVPHTLINGYKNVLGVALETDYSFEAADRIKEILADPSKFAAAAAPAAAAASSAAPAESAPAKEEEKEESDDDMGFGLFD